MKSLITMFTLLVAVPALACPNLSGKYNSCTTGDPGMDEVLELIPNQMITQVVLENGKTKFILDDGVDVEERVEGKTEVSEEVDPEFGNSLTRTTTKTSCSNDLLIISEKTEILDVLGDIDLDIVGQTEISATEKSLSVGIFITDEFGNNEEFTRITCQKE